MKSVNGNGVSIGSCIGNAFVYQNKIDLNAESKIAFNEAVKKLTSKFQSQIEDFKNNNRNEEAEVLDAYILILKDPEITGQITAENQSSVKEIYNIFDSSSNILASMEDEYFKQRAEDIISVGKHLINTMQEKEIKVELKENSVLVADDLTPADTSSMNMANVTGIILRDGGPTSHAVIVAKNLGIPCVIGVGESIEEIKNDDLIALNGATGKLNINPDKDVIESLNETKKREEEVKNSFTLSEYKNQDFEFLINVGSGEEIESFSHAFLNSIGLFRSEFIYLDRSSIPTIDEQRDILEKIQDKFSGTITYRTLDIGGDKQVDYLSLPVEENPFLGVRGIRLSLQIEELYRSQIESILTSRDAHRVKIMFPMISTIEDFLKSKIIIEEIAENLGKKMPEVGIMIETPSSTILVEDFAQHVDFFSIGTNDLTQYIMAADRGNPNLIEYQDSLHPAILRVLENVFSVSKEQSKEVSVCGEMASDPISAVALYVLGLRKFSMSSSAAPFVFEKLIKLKSMNTEDLKSEILKSTNSQEVRDKINKLEI
ncbi:phosphoenolpyruvate--protein phosphotransferase [Candidatus Actinomarina sp.]|jgi:phosphotransferase system enzyme I (PtsI)|nr:phosphoenolpyruvate--protein phosphotransferase [Acidimicrobiia bacterium]MDA8710320.1 phosphoenolpyruvate--protein phosphotransferase [Candidatus Actinomarina sp.]MDA8719492.1 phosphoenolpyruvate--protein phosphotransferase [Candidatus Actinomarina sp.]MDA8922778.1 phosphoenolpyruvate--protein phosphotransferase [Acidimicrobiia bacterium]MDA9173400.1 phosphoenolpyruvate--protein phosphotransferase [Acidimicrobiia bacterium]|tara:strand:- start:279 stop:1910 length:1632 start_codon:yes stop_codon:yes gene_type:complete